MQTTYTLAAEFGKSDGKSHRLRIKDVDLSKSAEEIKASLTKLTKLKLFEKMALNYFKKSAMPKLSKKQKEPFLMMEKLPKNQHSLKRTKQQLSKQWKNQ